MGTSQIHFGGLLKKYFKFSFYTGLEGETMFFFFFFNPKNKPRQEQNQ